MKVYLEFLRIFLEDINQLNKQFQEKSSQIFKINEVIIGYYNLLINLILKTEYEAINFPRKLKMIQKTNKIVYMAYEFFKIDDDFYKTLVDVHVYGDACHKIFFIIEIHCKKTVIIESIKSFILRILYKS